jgi:hypothetical protein
MVRSDEITCRVAPARPPCIRSLGLGKSIHGPIVPPPIRGIRRLNGPIFPRSENIMSSHSDEFRVSNKRLNFEPEFLLLAKNHINRAIPHEANNKLLRERLPGTEMGPGRYTFFQKPRDGAIAHGRRTFLFRPPQPHPTRVNGRIIVHRAPPEKGIHGINP